MDGFKDTKFECCDYRNLSPIDSVIYCDPPYNETTQYSKKIVGEFVSEEFWDVIRKWSKDNIVIVSEYNAPSDFDCIWEKKIKLDIRDSNNKRKPRVEKLFVSSGSKVMTKERGLFDLV